MKRFLCLGMLIAFCAGMGKGWYWLRDGFSIARLTGWNQSIPGTRWDPEADRALQQRFYYLGRGRQSFAFVSEDGNYVVKLPRGDYFQLPLWLRAISIKGLDSYRSSLLADQRRRELFLLESFQICFDELKDLTAIIGMNLSRQGLEGKSMEIVDRAGRCFEIPLKNTYFVLQHKKQIFQDVFEEAASKQGTPGVEKVVDELLALVVELAKKGLLNKDGRFLSNFACDEQRAYQIDVGSFYRPENLSPQEAYLISIQRSIGPVREWIEKKDPSWLTMIDQKLAPIYETGLRR